MALAENGNASFINTLGPMRYADTGERYPYDRYRVTLGDPMLYEGVDGRRIVPSSEFIPLDSKLEGLDINLEDVKRWLKVEHDMDDDFLRLITESAKEQAGGYLNRDWVRNDYPNSVRVDVLNIIAYRYEHRGDETSGELPPIPLPGLKRYRLLPGL